EAVAMALGLLARPCEGWAATALGLTCGDAGSVRRALEDWAWCLRHGMRQNARAGFLSPRQWCALAEAWLLAEGGGSPPLVHPGRQAAECLRQADRLFGLGAKWFGPGAAGELGRACRLLCRAPYYRAAAALASVRWYRAHAQRIEDPLGVPWWCPA